jgi:hypothetical protein
VSRILLYEISHRSSVIRSSFDCLLYLRLLSFNLWHRPLRRYNDMPITPITPITAQRQHGNGNNDDNDCSGAMTGLNLANNRLKTKGAKVVAEAIKVTMCTPAIILAPFSCLSDFSINGCCLLLSAGYEGPIGVVFEK